MSSIFFSISVIFLSDAAHISASELMFFDSSLIVAEKIIGLLVQISRFTVIIFNIILHWLHLWRDFVDQVCVFIPLYYWTLSFGNLNWFESDCSTTVTTCTWMSVFVSSIDLLSRWSFDFKLLISPCKWSWIWLKSRSSSSSLPIFNCQLSCLQLKAYF